MIRKDKVKKIIEKGQRIYNYQLKSKLEKKHKGEIIAIEVDSGSYFFGSSVLEAVKKGKKEYPHRIFHVVRVGHKAVHLVRIIIDD